MYLKSTRFFILFLTLAALRAEFSLQFTTILETEHRFTSAAFGNGTFVLVGEGGVVYTSTNGSNWLAGSTGFSNGLQGVSFGGGAFVACGNDGMIYESTNGLSWKRFGTRSTYTFKEPAYGNGGWVVVGTSGSVFYKRPGGSWQRNVFPTTADFVSVTFHENAFLAVTGKDLYRSIDGGESWTLSPEFSQSKNYFSRLRSDGNSLFILVNRPPVGLRQPLCTIHFKINGRPWESRGLSTQFGYFLSLGRGVYLAGGGYYWLATSFTGREWITGEVPDENGVRIGIGPMVYGLNRFVLVGDARTKILLSNPIPEVTFEPTPSPQEWTLRGPPGRYEIHAGLPDSFKEPEPPPWTNGWQTILTFTNQSPVATNITLPIQPEGHRFFRAIYTPE